ncbi:hypothetical protein DFH09DRAFT_868953, partial [Mycena vulgaris]
HRCRDCFGDDLLCAGCFVDRHAENSLHRVERWNGKFFEKTSLKTLGLCVQLGHPARVRCREPLQAHEEFVVLHTNGIHDVNIDLCDCEDVAKAGSADVQMLRAGWFPA